MVLSSTKQKEAQLETKLIAMLLLWLSLCFTGGFLMTFYMHFGYAFLFVFLYLFGCFLFYKKFKSSTDSQQLQLKAHLALSLVLRSENYINGCLSSRQFRYL